MSSELRITETSIIACAAALLCSYFAVQWAQDKRDRRREDASDAYGRRPEHFYAAPSAKPSFLENARTKVHDNGDETFLLQAKGWSMAEALAAAEKDNAKIEAMTPKEVLQSLQKGNSRFWTGRAKRPEVSAFERRVLINQQFPSTAILGCSDSRVPVEIVFDQGLGDMFVVRTAGNSLSSTTQASLEYAVYHLKVKVLLVMGHEGCGAVKAAGLPIEVIEGETESLSVLLKDIKAGLDSDLLSKVADSRARDREAVTTNVSKQIVKLTNETELMALVNAEKLKIVGGFYEISSGIVDFFMQVSKIGEGPFKPSPGVQSRYNPVTKEVVYA